MLHCVLYAPYTVESFCEQIFRTLLLLLRNILYTPQLLSVQET